MVSITSVVGHNGTFRVLREPVVWDDTPVQGLTKDARALPFQCVCSHSPSPFWPWLFSLSCSNPGMATMSDLAVLLLRFRICSPGNSSNPSLHCCGKENSHAWGHLGVGDERLWQSGRADSRIWSVIGIGVWVSKLLWKEGRGGRAKLDLFAEQCCCSPVLCSEEYRGGGGGGDVEY